MFRKLMNNKLPKNRKIHKFSKWKSESGKWRDDAKLENKVNYIQRHLVNTEQGKSSKELTRKSGEEMEEETKVFQTKEEEKTHRTWEPEKTTK